VYDARHDVDLTDGPWPAAVIRALPVGLLEMDAGGRVVRANRALVRLLTSAAATQLPLSGGRAVAEGRLVTECWPQLAESAVTVLSGRAVDTVIRGTHADLRVSGVPRWLGVGPNGGLLVVSVMAPDRTVVVDLRDGAGMVRSEHARADFGADSPSAGTGEPVVEREPPAEAERARLEALASYDLYDGVLDDALQAITQVAVAACGVAAALVTFVDSDLQWVRAVSGEDVTAFVDARAPRHLGLCERTIRGRDVLVVPDTRRDPAFQVSRHVGWLVGMRFYAGAPLVTAEERAIGTLCVLDSRPRELSERQRHSLAVLAAETVALLEPHRFR
jgi:hypothetical protein